VIGDGNSGVEAAIDLAGLGGQVTLLEFEDSLQADAVPAKQIVIAMGDGANAALGAFDSLLRAPVHPNPESATEPAEQVAVG
jgi:alkyl hydroperoxide reductase subunit AhpF